MAADEGQGSFRWGHHVQGTGMHTEVALPSHCPAGGPQWAEGSGWGRRPETHPSSCWGAGLSSSPRCPISPLHLPLGSPVARLWVGGTQVQRARGRQGLLEDVCVRLRPSPLELGDGPRAAWGRWGLLVRPRPLCLPDPRCPGDSLVCTRFAHRPPTPPPLAPPMASRPRKEELRPAPGTFP